MKEKQQLLLLLKAFINGQEPVILEDTDWERCNYLARIHNVQPIVYEMVKKKQQLFQQYPGIWEELRKKYHAAIFASVCQDEAMREIIEEFHNRNIPLVSFKGYCLKQFYPVKELRTMGDLDFLVRKEDVQRAGECLRELGFQETPHGALVWNYERNVVHLEMHNQISQNVLLNGHDYNRYFRHAMEHTQQWGDCRCFTPLYHLIYLFYHLAKHLNSTGAGIRMIMDFAVYLRHYEDRISFESLWRELEKLHLDGLAKGVFMLCNQWFDCKVVLPQKLPEDVMMQLEEYIVSGGIFGFAVRKGADTVLRKGFQNSRADSGFRYRLHLLRVYFFPGKEALLYRAPRLEKQGYLLPFYWILRWFQGIFLRGKNSVRTIRQLICKDSKNARKEFDLLKKLGL